MKKKLLNTLKYLWVVAIFVFVGRYLYTHTDVIVTIIKALPAINIITAFASLFFAKMLLTYVALLSVQYVTRSISFRQMLIIYNITQMAKYIPGSVWQFVGKAGAYNKHGMSAKNIKISMLIEMLWVLFSALLVGMIFLLDGSLYAANFFQDELKYIGLWYLLLFAVLLIVSYILKDKIATFLKIVISEHALNFRLSITLFFVWFFLGLSFFITLTPYLNNIDYSLFVNVLSLYAFSYFIGFLVPFAPAGIGIREAVLLSGISFIVPMDEAIVLVSLNRVIYILLEIAISLPLFFISLKKREDK